MRTNGNKLAGAAHAPVGVFDSGVGGLSVLRHVRAQLPGEDLLYFADTGFVPYGDKADAVIVQRSLAVAQYFLQQGVKALVVACNTATAAAIAALRHSYPELIIVGVEPGLKPAAVLSRSKTVGVLATKFTLESKKFLDLSEQLSAATGVRFLPQACVGLVDQIEKGELHSAVTAAMVSEYVSPLVAAGADTLVLGCTHYPFVRGLIEQAAGAASGDTTVQIVDTGEAVARQLARLLKENNCAAPLKASGSLRACTTASASSLAQAMCTLLQLPYTQDMITSLVLETTQASSSNIL